MPPDEQVLLQLVEGLNYIHSKDLVHRDVKPQNVLISVGAHNKVTMKWADFDLSKKSRDGQFSLTRTGGRTGTIGWIAPEILESGSDDTSSDGDDQVPAMSIS